MKKNLFFLVALVSGIITTSYAQNNYLNFDGVDDYVDLGNSIGNTSFRTIEMWFNPAENINATSNHYYNALIARDNDNQDCEFNISFSTEANPGKLAFGLAVTHLNYHYIYSDQNSWTAGTWYHVAVVIDTTGMRMYINGVLQSSTNPYNVTPCTTNDITALGRWGNFNIRHFKGSIDEVRIWDYVRTQSEIQNSLNSQLSGTESGLVAYYNFNQGVAGGTNPTINNLHDALNNFNGTLHNFTLSGPSSNWLGTGVTNVQNSQCGITLPSYASVVYANSVPGAQGYRFRVTNHGTNQVVVKDYTLRNLFMNTLSNFEYSQMYTIEVAVKRNNIWESFGAPCSITTASAFTQVITSQCGMNLTSCNTIIYADLVNAAQGYRFKITNLTTNSVQYIDTATRSFNFNLVSDYMDATTYQIEVAVKNTNGQYLPYGSSCTVTTPSVSMKVNDAVVTHNESVDSKWIGYPNPFTSFFKLQRNSQSDADVSVAIYDMLGKQVDYKNIAYKELEMVDFGTALNPGVYTVILTQEGDQEILKMVKR